MAETTKIEWATATFNPWRGCRKIAPGCKNCYAETLVNRFGDFGKRIRLADAGWKAPLKWNREAGYAQADYAAAHRTALRPRVFCASLADVFEEIGSDHVFDHKGNAIYRAFPEVTRPSNDPADHYRVGLDHLRRDLFSLIDATPNLDWLILTKRPENIRRMWPNRVAETFPVAGYLEDELKARGWTTRDCAERMGGDVDVNDLALQLELAVLDAPPDHAIQHAYMGERTASGLELAMGISAQTWINLDNAHRRGKFYRPNVWLLTSVSDQATADAAIPELIKCRDLAPVLGVSYEPALGPVDFRRIGKTLRGDDYDVLFGSHSRYQYKARNDSECSIGVHVASGASRLDWLIYGGESGAHARPADVAWARSTVEQCRAAQVPVFVKQLGAAVYETERFYSERASPPETFEQMPMRLKDKKGGDWLEWPEDLRVREFPKVELAHA